MTALSAVLFHTGGVAGDNITQGLPRVEELFEARKPKSLAVLAEFGGVVSFSKTEKKTDIVITDDEGNSKAYPVSRDTRVKVQEGQVVVKGEEITEGSENPHDIVRILGVRAVQDYMLREVQKVYRIQGVDINDKHIELIVRQMFKKIVIESAGDSDFLPGSQVAFLLPSSSSGSDTEKDSFPGTKRNKSLEKMPGRFPGTVDSKWGSCRSCRQVKKISSFLKKVLFFC